MGIRSVVAHSTADAGSLPVRLADESVCIGPEDSAQSYLNIPRLIAAAEVTEAEAIHPGYGFLAENATFAEICRACNIRFIGPSPEVIRLLGDKVRARELAKKADVPLLAGSDGAVRDEADAQAIAATLGYPVLLKASMGGGGRGIRIVWEADALAAAVRTCQAEAAAAFGSSEIYLEKYVEGARHVEVQVLADSRGHTIHLGERDCSVQRRHQKLVEESPCPVMTEAVRRELTGAALRICRAVGYENAGTVEFLLDQSGRFYFLEVNTRIQVEHPVTEAVTGVDLVRAQILIAAGEPLGLRQEDVAFRGHAIECRVTAEDPVSFAPSPGQHHGLRGAGRSGRSRRQPLPGGVHGAPATTTRCWRRSSRTGPTGRRRWPACAGRWRSSSWRGSRRRSPSTCASWPTPASRPGTTPRPSSSRGSEPTAGLAGAAGRAVPVRSPRWGYRVDAGERAATGCRLDTPGGA